MLHRIRYIGRIRNIGRECKAGAAVEFGIIFPLFVVLILGVADYGLVLFQMMAVSQAAQLGAQYAMLNGYNATNIENAVKTATGFTTVTATQSCGCATGTAITSTSCTQPLPSCGAGQPTAGSYVTVNVQYAYSPAAPGIPSPLTAQVMIRIE